MDTGSHSRSTCLPHAHGRCANVFVQSIWDATDIPPRNDDPFSGPPLAFCIPSSTPPYTADPWTSPRYPFGWRPDSDSPLDIASITAVLLARTQALSTPAAATSTAPTASSSTSQMRATTDDDSDDDSAGSCPSLRSQSDSGSER